MVVMDVMLVSLSRMLILNERTGAVYFLGDSTEIPFYLLEKNVTGLSTFNRLLYVYISM